MPNVHCELKAWHRSLDVVKVSFSYVNVYTTYFAAQAEATLKGARSFDEPVEFTLECSVQDPLATVKARSTTIVVMEVEKVIHHSP